MIRAILILLMLPLSLQAQLAPFSSWKIGAVAWTPLSFGDSVKFFAVMTDVKDSLGKAHNDTTGLVINRARFNPFALSNAVHYATSSAKPVYHDSLNFGQITFDGVDDIMDAVGATYSQPLTVVAVMKAYKPAGGFLFYWGSNVASATEACFLNDPTGIAMDAGSSSPSTGALVADSVYSFICYYNRAGSTLDRNGIIKIGDSGSEPLAGLRLMSRAAGGLYGAGMYRMFLIVHRALTADEITQLKTYIADNFGVNYP